VPQTEGFFISGFRLLNSSQFNPSIPKFPFPVGASSRLRSVSLSARSFVAALRRCVK
jgi:hypothetical protein